MSGFQKKTVTIAQDVWKSFLKKAQSRKSSIESTGTNDLQNAFSDPSFSRPPIDTGKSQRSSEMKLQFKSLSIVLRYIVDTPQATFFIRGLGSNRKYGRRNVLRKASKKRMVVEMFKKS